jgi:hypothetical protein
MSVFQFDLGLTAPEVRRPPVRPACCRNCCCSCLPCASVLAAHAHDFLPRPPSRCRAPHWVHPSPAPASPPLHRGRVPASRPPCPGARAHSRLPFPPTPLSVLPAQRDVCHKVAVLHGTAHGRVRRVRPPSSGHCRQEAGVAGPEGQAPDARRRSHRCVVGAGASGKLGWRLAADTLRDTTGGSGACCLFVGLCPASFLVMTALHVWSRWIANPLPRFLTPTPPPTPAQACS